MRKTHTGLLLAVLLLLISGLLGGLLRIGWPLPGQMAALARLHGPLMICGVLGTLIGLERAAAQGKAWGWAAPLLSAGGMLSLLAGLPTAAGAGLILGAAAVQLALLRQTAHGVSRQVQILGLFCWMAGTVLWLLGGSMPLVALWWSGMLLLTIAGGRMNAFEASGRGLTSGAIAFVAGLTLASAWPDAGLRLSALGLAGCSLWLLRHDPACRRAKAQGPARFMAFCLLAGYAWLAVAALLLLTGASALTGFYYDMTLHSLFVGFVLSLVLAHLPRVMAQLLGRPEAYHAGFWLWLLLLQLSLLLRLGGGLQADSALRAWGGMLNLAALLGFVLQTILLSLRPRKS